MAGGLPNYTLLAPHAMPRSGLVPAALSGALVAVAHGKPHTIMLHETQNPDHLQLSYCSGTFAKAPKGWDERESAKAGSGRVHSG